MPTYEYFCHKCKKPATIVLTLQEHEKKKAVCPRCGNTRMRQRVTSFMTKTTRKS